MSQALLTMLLLQLYWHAVAIVVASPPESPSTSCSASSTTGTCSVSASNNMIFLPPNTPLCIAPRRLPVDCVGMPGAEHYREWSVVLEAFPCGNVLDLGANEGCLTALALGRGAKV
jgi:hypothetical protein